MGYGDWVHITIFNTSRSRALKISHIEALYGKFYDGNNKDNEVQAATFVNKTAEPNLSIEFYACGRSDSPTGTEGNVTLVDKDTGVEIANIYWLCPFSGSNEFSKTRENAEEYIVALSPYDTEGPLGDVTCKIAYMG